MAQAAYTQTKFLGATVIDFSCSAGWNEQSSTCTVSVAEDNLVGDDFFLKTENVANYQGQMIGTATNFTLGGFSFSGLIQSFKQTDSFQGHPTYQINLISPIILLEGTQVIMSNYVGPVNDSLFNALSNPTGMSFSLRNVLNVYGYLEDGGNAFGDSEINDAGLLWEGSNGVKQALENLTAIQPPKNTNFNFGSSLSYRGCQYQLDLSAIPTAPSFYRIGGSVTMTLLDIISQVCLGAGVRYIIKLTLSQSGGPHTISLAVSDLVISPNLNQIANYVAGLTSSGQVAESEVGQELRTGDEAQTQAMILGGAITTLTPIPNTNPADPVVQPFWGFDFNGNPILGRTPRGDSNADDDHQMNLNASEIADILGAFGLPPVYDTSILELRYALVDYDSWAAFLFIDDPAFAIQLGIYSAGGINLDGGTPLTIKDWVNDSIDFARQAGGMNTSTQLTTVSQRVYQFVAGQAQIYYGVQFAVKIPFNLQVKLTPETDIFTFSDEPCDAAFLPEGLSPLGLNQVNENFFLTDDGRFSPFLRFAFNSNFNSVSSLFLGNPPDIRNIDPHINNNSLIVQPDPNPANIAVYTQYSVPDVVPTLQNNVLRYGRIIFIPGGGGFLVPAMICTIGSPIFAQAQDPLGGIPDIAATFGLNANVIYQNTQWHPETFPIKIAPPAFYPNGVAMALKSNEYLYGPWGKYVADGKTEIIFDDGLTPWDYGDYNTMNQAALAQLLTIPTPVQVQETASVKVPGVPSISLGEVLVLDGPCVSNISGTISVGGGATTTYTMETFVPRFGVFANENKDRLKRLGKLSQQLRASLRKLLLAQLSRQQVINAANFGLNNGLTYAAQAKTPHGVLGGHLIYNSGTQEYVPIAYTQTYRESVANVNAQDDDLFRISSAMSLDGLVRPFSTSIHASGLSHYWSSDKIISQKTPIVNSGIQPLQQNSDFGWYSSGKSYHGMNISMGASGTLEDARLMGLRGPLVMTGWCYDLIGNPIPNLAASGNNDLLQNFNTSFASGYLVNSWQWPAGAVDLRWDKWRGVFSFPTLLTGILSGQTPLGPGGQGTMIIQTGDGTQLPDTMPIYNNYKNGSVQPSSVVWAGYLAMDNRWYAITSDCPTSP